MNKEQEDELKKQLTSLDKDVIIDLYLQKNFDVKVEENEKTISELEKVRESLSEYARLMCAESLDDRDLGLNYVGMFIGKTPAIAIIDQRIKELRGE